MDGTEGSESNTAAAIATTASTAQHQHGEKSSKSGYKDAAPSGDTTTQTDGSALPTVEEALTAMEAMVKDGRLSSSYDKNCLKVLLKEHDSHKEKITKLKALLGRSAKAQRELKVEAETSQKRLQEAQREIERLTEKVDKLATRPTHMELLADFETNFDRALLSVHQQHVHHQAGGESTADQTVADVVTASPVAHRGNIGTSFAGGGDDHPESAVVDGLLLQELQESKQRNEKLESLNAALLHRSSQLENEAKERRREREELFQKITHLELEKRMAVMEAEHAAKALHEKAASLAEMQMEIDLVSKASVKAQRRAAKDEELIKSVKTDQRYVHQLETQVQALQEWATAAAEAKTLAQERILLLEAQVKSLHQQQTAGDGGLLASTQQVVIWDKVGSLVIGAGDIGVRIFECDGNMLKGMLKNAHHYRVILRWQFDLTAQDLSIDFSAYQGRCETKEDRKKAASSTPHGRALFVDRVVQGGAGGDLENAFFYQDACTLVWSNVKSWVRPRTVRYTVQAVAVSAGVSLGTE